MRWSLRKFAVYGGRTLIVAAVALMTAWGYLALEYGLGEIAVRPIAKTIWTVAGGAAILGVLVRRLRRTTWIAYAMCTILLFAWWTRVQPSNDRVWQTEVAVLPSASFDGELVTIRNIRNFDYRSETEFSPGYYDKTFDLRDLDSADLIASYWTGPSIAHIMLSFGFAGRDFLAISIETRKEQDEAYSTVAGFFKQYELFYVVADERDVLRLRTNYRKDPPEDVFLYRLRGDRENRRRLFLDYLQSINDLNEHPQFYDTLTTNCTTTILWHARMNPGRVPFSWKILVSGHVPEYLYEHGRINHQLPFAELQSRARINDAALAADGADDFSQRIRAGLLMP